jgi:AraC-like DNA-binding protein
MGKTRTSSSQLDHQLNLGNDGAMMRRRMGFLPDGAYFFEDQLEIKGVLTAKVITCAAWLLELYRLEAGELFFIRGDENIRPRAKSFGVFYPPFTISQPCFKNASAHLIGVAASASLPADLATVPILFETSATERPSGAAQVIEILHSAQGRQAIEMNPRPSLLSLKAKRLIDENYLVYPSITRIALKLGVAHEHLSRQFKRDFGMSPSDYLRQLRMADAPLLLARGEQIIKVSQSVGYNDLSRFYKQFRKTTKTSPGVCQTMMKPKRDKPDQS